MEEGEGKKRGGRGEEEGEGEEKERGGEGGREGKEFGPRFDQKRRYDGREDRKHHLII